MKIDSLRVLALVPAALCLYVNPAHAEAIFTRPEANAPVIATTPTGQQPQAAAGVTAPAGWIAIQLPGPHEVYVYNGDLLKDMTPKPGVAFHTRPDASSPVLATADPGVQCEITGLVGKWTQFELKDAIIGYVQTNAPATPAPVPAPAATSAPAPKPAPSAAPSGQSQPTPVTDANSTVPATGRAVQTAAPSARYFEGRIVSTRNPLRPRRPYDYQLNDESGHRLAYLDFSPFPAVENLSDYVDHTVILYGTPHAVPDSKDLVIAVQSAQLR